MLHTIGGDDTNTTAADLAAFLARNDYPLTVVGLPKTIDNDVVPIRQSLGAWTAAEQGARFAQNIIGEHNSGSRMLIVHEVMGRHCGWLTAATAQAYREWLDTQEWLPEIGLSREAWDVHGVYVPEAVLRPGGRGGPADRGDGPGRLGQPVPLRGRRAGDHRRRAGAAPARRWPATRSATSRSTRSTRASGSPASSPSGSGRRRCMVQKSGYFSRSAAANARDLELIRSMTDLAVDCALRGESGVIGHDEERGDELRAIEFDRIKGGKPFDIGVDWFAAMLDDIGQPPAKAAAPH